MNIFATNDCPVISAQEHCDVHLRKMIVEIAQLLSTAHVVLDSNQVAYKATHINHPCAIWVRECYSNYMWAFDHLIALCLEYTKRTGKTHATDKIVISLCNAPRNICSGERTPFAMAMPDHFKSIGVFDQTVAYRAYLNQKFKEWGCRAKPIKVEWTGRSKPNWVEV